MRTNRTWLLRAGMLAGAAALAVAGAVWPAAPSPVHASPAHAAPAPATAATAVAPAARAQLDAPTGGEVAGLQHGAQVTHNGPADVAEFRAAHAGLISPAAAPGGSRAGRQIHPSQGTGLRDVAGASGASATQSIAPNLGITDAGSTVYTPTLYPAGGACIEVATRYVPGSRSVGAWDWCNSNNFAVAVPIDATFIAKYTRSDNAYSARVIQTDAGKNTWTAALFDYQTNTWDTLFTSSGSTQGGRGGWDIYELYSNLSGTGQSNVCADLQGSAFVARDIAVRTGADTWSKAAAGNADTHYDQPPAAFDCPSMHYRMVENYDHWEASG